MNTDSDMYFMYNSLISEGDYLLKELEEKHTSVDGMYKLKHKIKRDISCLTKAMLNNKMKKEHVACTNLNVYKGLVKEMIAHEDVEAVLETFLYRLTDGTPARLTVDIVSDKGRKWTKIVARNPLALQLIYREGDGFGRRSIIDQAKSYIEAANQNLHLYTPPQVVFCFINGVPEKMKEFLQKIGITVEGRILALENSTTGCCSTDSDEENNDHLIKFNNLSISSDKQENTNKINLCVTTMIAFVSSLTNGGCNKRFLEPLLNQQAEWERVRPVKPHLTNLFKGKILIACSSAVLDFKAIIENIGGENEKSRADALLSTVEVVPDVPFTALNPSGQIKRRSLVIFGTGDHHRAVTLTANKGFVFASKQKGMKFAVIIHESRALTERKELP